MRKTYSPMCVTSIVAMLALAFTQSNAPTVSGNQQQSPLTREEKRQRDREKKRQSFKSGRDLLRKRGVPFDPDLLLEPGFKTRLAAAFAAMREFSESRLVGRFFTVGLGVHTKQVRQPARSGPRTIEAT